MQKTVASHSRYPISDAVMIALKGLGVSRDLRVASYAPILILVCIRQCQVEP